MAMPLLLAALLMRAGVTLYTAGLSRAKNAASSAFRCVIEFFVATIAFAIIGMRILFASWTHDWTDPNLLTGLAAILFVSGWFPSSIAERSRLRLLFLLSLLLAGIILPWTSGFYTRSNFIDHAGAIWLFLPTGILALLAAKFLGPRDVKFNRDGSTNGIPGHNIIQAILGFLLMSTAFAAELLAQSPVAHLVLAVLNFLLCTSTAGLVACAYCRIAFSRIDPVVVMSAALASMVGISAAAPDIPALAAALVGLILGIATPWLLFNIEFRAKIDDIAGLAVVAITGGLLGPIISGVFTIPLSVLAELEAIGIIGGLTLIVSLLFLLIFRAITPLRAHDADEAEGLDITQHDLNAYPDFQQTMIKSYHLRER